MDLIYNEKEGYWEEKKEAYAVITCPTAKAYVKVVGAINKQKAKKPMWKADKGFDFEDARRLRCPSCNNPIVSQFVRDYKPKHCSECGQKLDWSDV